MSNKMITFALNNKANITMELAEPLYTIHCCTQAPIFFLQSNTKVLLSDDSIQSNIESLAILLNKALHNDILLHPSIVGDVGFMYNEELQNKPGMVYTKLEGRDYWVGNNNNLWSPCIAKNNLASWLYNTADGSIIFEVTPVYPYHFVNPAEHADVIPYQEWIKTYKPYVIKTILHAVARKWLEQAHEILAQIEDNNKQSQ